MEFMECEMDLTFTESFEKSILGAGQDLEPYTFLSVPETLWAQENGKISGTYSWSFSINVPHEVDIPGNAQTPAKSYPLPPRFSERGSQAHIDYRIVVSVRRRRFSADSTYAFTFFHARMANNRVGSQVIYTHRLPTVFHSWYTFAQEASGLSLWRPSTRSQRRSGRLEDTSKL